MIKKTINVEIGKRIHIARERRHMTQEVLAEKLDLSTQYISDVERGASGISIDTLINICEVLSVSSDYLLFGNITSSVMEDTVVRVNRLTKAEQELVNRSINTTLEALNFHEEDNDKDGNND